MLRSLTKKTIKFNNCNKIFNNNNYKNNIGACCVKPYFEETTWGDSAFSVRNVNLKYGKGILEETGSEAQIIMQRSYRDSYYKDQNNKSEKIVALFTDKNVKQLEGFNKVLSSFEKVNNVKVVVYDEVRVEPTDESFMEAARFLKEVKPHLMISFGGGSVMDTAKAALVYSIHPNDFLHYVNAPVGEGKEIPHDLCPHIAIPTTSGTGSECTGFAICALKDHPTAPYSKTGIASPSIVPALAVVDPTVTFSLPETVVAASGFDVLSHALESYTAKAFTKREKNPAGSHLRPLNQGANPYADIGCLTAIQICSEYFERAITDPNDHEARENMMFASTIVGAAMGNVGVHLPHGLSYPVCGRVSTVSDWNPSKIEGRAKTSGYPPDKPLIPHGMGVSLCAPAAFRKTAEYCPERHVQAAKALGLNVDNINPVDSGHLIADEIIRLMKLSKFPLGIGKFGFDTKDQLNTLTDACFQQKRVINNAPFDVQKTDIFEMYSDAVDYCCHNH